MLAALTALVFPDMKVFDIVDDVTAGTAIPLGAVAKMTGLALLYLVVYTGIACFTFSDKEF